MAHQVRTCLLCGGSDDHPRIIQVSTVPGAPDVQYHHDCAALAWPDSEIAKIVEHAGGKQGDELREYLMSDGHRKFKAKLEAQAEGAKA